MAINVFAFLLESYILKKRLSSTVYTEFCAIYTRVVNLLNKNGHFKDWNIETSTQRCIAKIWESKGINK